MMVKKEYLNPDGTTYSPRKSGAMVRTVIDSNSLGIMPPPEKAI